MRGKTDFRLNVPLNILTPLLLPFLVHFCTQLEMQRIFCCSVRVVSLKRVLNVWWPQPHMLTASHTHLHRFILSAVKHSQTIHMTQFDVNLVNLLVSSHCLNGVHTSSHCLNGVHTFSHCGVKQVLFCYIIHEFLCLWLIVVVGGGSLPGWAKGVSEGWGLLNLKASSSDQTMC